MLVSYPYPCHPCLCVHLAAPQFPKDTAARCNYAKFYWYYMTYSRLHKSTTSRRKKLCFKRSFLSSSSTLNIPFLYCSCPSSLLLTFLYTKKPTHFLTLPISVVPKIKLKDFIFSPWSHFYCLDHSLNKTLNILSFPNITSPSTWLTQHLCIFLWYLPSSPYGVYLRSLYKQSARTSNSPPP